MELWGGVECTVNRVGDGWQDQSKLTGHEQRLSDIDLIAELGLSATRYPILWERVAPDSPDVEDWPWTDARLARLAEHKLRVIAGLIHHGSGPRYTNLLDPGFAPGLARHARSAAERYPWIEDWTPVNEPVTTARFSALYGVWYPHARDERSFWLALLNQIDATRLAMREVRAVNPAARLIQTDDLGRTYSTAPLHYQARFDNLRRWAGWDLLCGHVTPGHPLFGWIASFGFGDRLRAIADDPCPPDVIGVNHYLTSDRFLDHRVQLYPALQPGGNRRQRYVDVEAIRVLDPAPQGLEGALREAWERYRIPIAVTEAHNGCTRDEQMRWMARAWEVAQAASRDGIDLRAVTSWALFGSSGWNTLLTGPGVYEPGAFDVSGGKPRPTALTRLLRNLASDGDPGPIATALGWWERPCRLLYPAVQHGEPVARRFSAGRGGGKAPPILVCGATGTLGRAIAQACRHRNLAYALTSRADLSLDCDASIDHALDRHRPWAVINAAGWVRVDDAEAEEAACFAANADGAVALARACAARDIPTVSFSSDLVFDGAAGQPYDEQDMTAPLNVYGRSKVAAEQRIAELAGKHLLVRTAAFFSPFDPHNFAWAVLQALRRGERFRAASDYVVSPTYVPHLANAVLDLAIDGEAGVWHLSNGTAVSWTEFARAVAAACELDVTLIEPVPGEDLGWRAKRPTNSALTSRRGKLLPPLNEALIAFARDAGVATANLSLAA
ncbi:sugar nucleotide-binding protein [Sphingomonas sp.]|jgi:dTDP-4-dehydrorhamnose reductase|uniref:sugar nucleotide-binding protein n=1 Tax=Sphingomonas sp. TaxID=28214 RepID=UPI002E309F77|nr:sugar nucleotide-binding protein [Sphingomonas sp.]HEX4694677.1 sugar nucleotide-binding protein [Sphingomonas sp.]